MIKYQTQDLIKRAQQLADLENSDFISWNENIMAINEAFSDIYQRAINRDELFYLKEVELAGTSTNNITCYDLPCDFYQLYSLNNLRTNTCIVRNSVNDPLNTKGYNIINNQLVVRGSSEPLVMKYFPEPLTLLYPAPDKNLFINSTIQVAPGQDKALNIDIGGTKIYTLMVPYGNYSQYAVAWYDIVSGEESSQSDFSSSEAKDIKIIGCKDGGYILGENTTEGKAKYTYYNDNFEKVDPLNNDYPVLFIDTDKNPLFFSPENKTFYTLDGLEYLTITDNALAFLSQIESADHYLTGCVDRESNKCFFTEVSRADLKKTRNFYVYDFSKDVFKKTATKAHSVKYILEKNGVNLYFDMASSSINDFNLRYSIGSNYIGINKLDFDTGYGATKRNGVVHSFIVNTMCDYPNNLFINMLAYKLAIMYKSKQGGDITGLGALFQQAESQFYDSLTRDDFSVSRIQNVY